MKDTIDGVNVIKEDEIMQRIMNIKLMQKWDESSEDYKKRVLEYMKENEVINNENNPTTK